MAWCRRFAFFMILWAISTAMSLSARAHPESDAASIPLDPKAPELESWDERRDTSEDPKREPGLINIQRYDGGLAWTGIPSFFMLPLALTPEDLRAGDVDVALLGAPLDIIGHAGRCIRS